MNRAPGYCKPADEQPVKGLDRSVPVAEGDRGFDLRFAGLASMVVPVNRKLPPLAGLLPVLAIPSWWPGEP